MNKALIATLLLSTSPAMAGQPLTCSTPPPAPPAKDCPLTLELAAVYAFANSDILSHGSGAEKDIDLYGGDITAVYALNERHSANLRFGYAFGDEVNRFYGTRYETDVHNFYLMPGYRYTHAINDRTDAYFGVNVGIANLSIKTQERDAFGTSSDHNSAYGFAYSAEVGLRYKINENCTVFAAYEFCGSTATPDIRFRDSIRSGNNQSYNAVRAGASFRF